MIFLNINNIEEIIFKNKDIRVKLPDFKYLFDAYDLGMFSPSLKSLAMRCLNDFLKKCTKKEIDVLRDFLKDDVEIMKLNADPVMLFDNDINDLELLLSNDYNCSDVCIYRKGNQIKGLLWK